MACNKKSFCKNSGFTLIELLVVLGILFIFLAIISGSFNGCSSSDPVPFDRLVTDKWTDVDGDGDTVYRIRTVAPNGEVDTYNSFWVHNKVSINGYYRFTVKFKYMISTAEPIQPPQPSQPQQAEQNVSQ